MVFLFQVVDIIIIKWQGNIRNEEIWRRTEQEPINTHQLGNGDRLGTYWEAREVGGESLGEMKTGKTKKTHWERMQWRY